ncbi:MAG: hypothetical protein IJT47_05310 [Selenomonadaceae bacterium]|nr:hypothetical protein [Selenomonadaceae bacterium]MBQ7493826.1 hypothetical protein [Selenomonadaceae bacterium]
MRLVRFFSLLAVAVLCTVAFSATASARPEIHYKIDNVYLPTPGEATIEGHFENNGDTDAYAKWVEFDLILTADNGQQMWADYGIKHNFDIYIPAYSSIEYTFYIQHPDIPEYHNSFNWQYKRMRTHWDTSAG